jgi:hypothetical protein
MNKELSKSLETETIQLLKDEKVNLQQCAFQTKQICLEAVKLNGLNLEYVKNKDNDICLEAVKEYGFALQFVENPTEEVIFEALKQNGRAIRFVENPTDEMCKVAVNQTGDAIQFIKNQTKELCELSLLDKEKPGLKHIKRQTKNICRLALEYSIINNLDECRININEPDYKLVIAKQRYYNLLCEKIDGKWLCSMKFDVRIPKEELIKKLSDKEMYYGLDEENALEVLKRVD